MADLDRNKAAVAVYADAFDAGDTDRPRRLHTPDALIHGVLGWGPIDEVLPIWSERHGAFAIHLSLEDIAAEGERVGGRFTERGRFRADFRGKAATGKPYEIAATEWYEMRDGLIHRRWGARDTASQARQIEMT